MKNVLKLKLGTKISIFSGIPLVLALILAVSVIYKQRNEYVSSEVLESRVKLLAAGSRLVAELQKERGVSAGYLGGGMTLSQLEQQRGQADDRLPDFLNIVKKVKFDGQTLMSEEWLRESVGQVRELTDSKSPTKQVIGKYTKMISKILSAYELVAQQNKLPRYSGIIRSLSIVEAAKEASGKLRANMVGILASNKAIGQGKFNALLALKAGVDINMSSPALVLSDKSQGTIRNFKSSDHWAKVNQVFALILKKANKGNYGENSGSFFNTITKSVNAIGSVVAEETNYLSLESQNQKEAANRNFWMFSSTVCVASLLLLVMIFSFLWKITRAFSKLAGGLEGGTNQLLGLSKDLQGSSLTLAGSVNQQASASQECVSSMSEMTSMISQTSDYSKHSSNLSKEVRARTEEGGQTMENLVSSMEQIQQANVQLEEMEGIISEISQKTNVINDIVFKTQLLSFNASIEAARAGQHGKGFAVVAEEVGNLAQMSGKAAGEIRVLLDNSQKQVNQIVESTQQRVTEGQSVTQRALEIFNQVTADVNTISEQIEQIDRAAKEQTAGVQQTQEAVRQLDEATEQNNIIATKTSEFAESLGELGNSINEIKEGLNVLVQGGSETGDNSQALAAGLVETVVNKGIKFVKNAKGKDEKSNEKGFSPEGAIKNIVQKANHKKGSNGVGENGAAYKGELTAEDDDFQKVV